MLFVALRRLSNRLGLTLLSIIGVTLAVGLAVSIPVFAKAVSFVVLREELAWTSALTQRPAFSIHVYVLPAAKYVLSLHETRAWEEHIAETIVSEVKLPLIAKHRQVETKGLVMRTRGEDTAYGPARTVLLQDTQVTILPGVESKLTILDGESMDTELPPGDELRAWMHHTIADETGVRPGEVFELYDSTGGVTVPVRVAGTWKATDPSDDFWYQNPDLTLRRTLLVREEDYEAIAEPAFHQRLGYASWYLILDHSQLTSENMREHATGLRNAERVINRYLPDPRMDSSPLQALETALKRESDLTVLLFVFSVPVVGFLLYFVGLISSITIRWQRRETAIMVSRGMYGQQLLAIGSIEACLVVGLGSLLGVVTGIQLARAMGYAKSFMQFTWRSPLPVSSTAINVPILVAILTASLLARLWPVLRSMRTGVVAHERRRARPPDKPFWQRFYLDFVLLIAVIYAYRRLSVEGTLVPQAAQSGSVTTQDPLLFLVPALFTLTLSLLLVRLFPIWMRILDGLGALGRGSTGYLAFRQLARQSGQYASALLLVSTSLSLGTFIASMADSLDQWLLDQVYYAVGADVYIRQMLDPQFAEAGLIPPDGAWVLPIESYLDLQGVKDATRVGMYSATIHLDAQRSARGTFIGVDRLDLPGLLFFRPDFATDSLGGLMNRLASREDAVLVSERLMAEGGYEMGDRISVRIVFVDVLLSEIALTTDFTIAGTYTYFPTVYEESDGGPTLIGNLSHVFEQIGGPALHDTWLEIEPDADKVELVRQVEGMRVFIKDWREARALIAEEMAKAERVGIFGTLTIGFLSSALFAGIGLLIYNYASLQERLFRFTILRAVGLTLLQVISQVTIEYIVLMVYSVAGGAAIGVWASRLFISFFQAADKDVLRPPSMIPLVAWMDIGQISGAFIVALVVAQVIVIGSVLRKGVFQALRMGDQE